MLRLSILSCLVAHVLAQTDMTYTGNATQTSLSTSPTVSLFLPIVSHDSLQASVVAVVGNQTAFALTCASSTGSSRCPYSPAFTVTEGASTVIWTNTFSATDTMVTAGPVTVRCQLVGAVLDETPIQGATSAVCTANSAISGLGVVGSSSTLASTEINYVPVTITAGAEKLIAASTLTAEPTTTTSQAGAAPVISQVAGLGLGGMIGIAVLGAL